MGSAAHLNASTSAPGDVLDPRRGAVRPGAAVTRVAVLRDRDDGAVIVISWTVVVDPAAEVGLARSAALLTDTRPRAPAARGDAEPVGTTAHARELDTEVPHSIGVAEAQS